MINSVCGIRSTGRICTDLAQELEKQGHEVKIAYGRENVPEEFQKYAVRIGNNFDVKLHGIRARLFDEMGFGSKRATKKFIDWIKEYNPDLIHLHNIHGYYINIVVLFEYLKNCRKKIIWTLHDCWAFTGHCCYFDYVECNKWKYGCNHCQQKKQYPKSLFADRSEKNYFFKKQLFTDIPNLVLVTPSYWLQNLLKYSFLMRYPTKVIHNGIDTNIFRPKIDNNLQNKYRFNNKKIVLGVASTWDKRKGLNSFIKLSQLLNENYQIVLIGLNNKQIKILPDNIIGIKRTNNVQELAAFYTMANVFVNTTLEDNYPTTNLEAIACGTPVITYETGGSVESASYFGDIVPKDDLESLVYAIYNINSIKKQKITLDYKEMVKSYISLYNG